MNVVKKRGRKPKNNDFGDFNLINPAYDAAGNYHTPEELSIKTVATVGNSVFRQSTTYASITIGRGFALGEVGLAYIDIESPEVKLTQFSDDPWYTGLLTKLNTIEPCQIILPHTIFEAKPETSDGKLMKYLREYFPYGSFVKVPRRHYSDSDGLYQLNLYCSEKYQYEKSGITTKYYALAAVAGLFKFLQFIHKIYFKEHSLRLEFGTKYAHMQIDIDSSYKLELLSQRSHIVHCHFPSLYDVLNNCVTSFGKRTLRAKILEPTCDIPSIQKIHECIEELKGTGHIQLIPMLKTILKKFNGVERLHKLALVVPQGDNIHAAEILINQALHLRTCLQLVPALREKMQTLKCQQFQEIYENLTDQRYQTMLAHIDEVINPNLVEYKSGGAAQTMQRMECVRSGVNDILDVLRGAYAERLRELEQQVLLTSQKYGQVFRMHYTKGRGYHAIVMVPNRAAIDDLGEELEVIDFKGNACSVTTSEITKLNIRISGVIEEVTMQTNVVIAKMITEIVKEIDILYDLSGFIATLDVLVSLATASYREGYVRPTFAAEMRLVDAIHPLLEKDMHHTVAVTNNVIATPDYNFYMITGPNMSGKTVYIKMIAILQVMAQLGCYVPAKSAQFRITDRIFTRMGFNDSIEKKASTFQMEMNNMEFILKNVTPNSLVVIDELCRSTNPKEGVELAWKMSEQLGSIHGIANDGEYFTNDNAGDKRSTRKNDGDESEQHTPRNNDDMGSSQRTQYSSADVIGSIPSKEAVSVVSSHMPGVRLCEITSPFIYLTTHYNTLTKLSETYFNVVNLNFSAEEIMNANDETSLKFNHRIQEGVTTTQSYGLALAKTLRFPADVIARAFEYYIEFTTGDAARNSIPETNSNRHLSHVGRKILHLLPGTDAHNFETDGSVVAIAITGSKKAKSRFVVTSSGRTTKTTSTGFAEDHLKVDRILYNLHGELASALRKVKYEYGENVANGVNMQLGLHEAQNNALEHVLDEFVDEQPKELIAAMYKLEISSDGTLSESDGDRSFPTNFTDHFSMKVNDSKSSGDDNDTVAEIANKNVRPAPKDANNSKRPAYERDLSTSSKDSFDKHSLSIDPEYTTRNFSRPAASIDSPLVNKYSPSSSVNETIHGKNAKPLAVTKENFPYKSPSLFSDGSEAGAKQKVDFDTSSESDFDDVNFRKPYPVHKVYTFGSIQTRAPFTFPSKDKSSSSMSSSSRDSSTTGIGDTTTTSSQSSDKIPPKISDRGQESSGSRGSEIQQPTTAMKFDSSTDSRKDDFEFRKPYPVKKIDTFGNNQTGAPFSFPPKNRSDFSKSSSSRGSEMGGSTTTSALRSIIFGNNDKRSSSSEMGDFTITTRPPSDEIPPEIGSRGLSSESSSSRDNEFERRVQHPTTAAKFDSSTESKKGDFEFREPYPVQKTYTFGTDQTGAEFSFPPKSRNDSSESSSSRGGETGGARSTTTSALHSIIFGNNEKRSSSSEMGDFTITTRQSLDEFPPKINSRRLSTESSSLRGNEIGRNVQQPPTFGSSSDDFDLRKPNPVNRIKILENIRIREPFSPQLARKKVRQEEEEFPPDHNMDYYDSSDTRSNRTSKLTTTMSFNMPIEGDTLSPEMSDLKLYATSGDWESDGFNSDMDRELHLTRQTTPSIDDSQRQQMKCSFSGNDLFEAQDQTSYTFRENRDDANSSLRWPTQSSMNFDGDCPSLNSSFPGFRKSQSVGRLSFSGSNLTNQFSGGNSSNQSGGSDSTNQIGGSNSSDPFKGGNSTHQFSDLTNKFSKSKLSKLLSKAYDLGGGNRSNISSTSKAPEFGTMFSIRSANRQTSSESDSLSPLRKILPSIQKTKLQKPVVFGNEWPDTLPKRDLEAERRQQRSFVALSSQDHAKTMEKVKQIMDEIREKAKRTTIETSIQQQQTEKQASTPAQSSNAAIRGSNEKQTNTSTQSSNATMKDLEDTHSKAESDGATKYSETFQENATVKRTKIPVRSSQTSAKSQDEKPTNTSAQSSSSREKQTNTSTQSSSPAIQDPTRGMQTKIPVRRANAAAEGTQEKSTNTSTPSSNAAINGSKDTSSMADTDEATKQNEAPEENDFPVDDFMLLPPPGFE